MLCKACASIPLDLFLPLQGSHRRFKNGKAWHCAYMHTPGADGPAKLAASASAGCPMCKILVAALDAAEPFWAIGGAFTSRGHNMLLNRTGNQSGPPPEGITMVVRNEGELIVADGQKQAGLYWKYGEYGQARGESIHPGAGSE